MKITFPVTVSKREELLKSKDIEFELLENHIKVSVKYISKCPKDKDDEYSEMVEELKDFSYLLLKSSIAEIWWLWDKKDEVWVVEFTSLSGEGHGYNCQSKEEALEIYGKLTDWWLKP